MSAAPRYRMESVCGACHPELLDPRLLVVHEGNFLASHRLLSNAHHHAQGDFTINGIPVPPTIIIQASIGPNGWLDIIHLNPGRFDRVYKRLGLPGESICTRHVEPVLCHHVLFGDVRAQLRDR